MDLAPLDAGTTAALRLLVFGLRRGTRARTFSPVVHVGVPGGEVYVAPADVADHALRSDLVLTLLAMHRDEARPGVWLTRSGTPDEHDLDLAWLAAARAGFRESAADLPWFVVVTKQGWRRPATDEGRRWQRLRLRGAARPVDG
ncbi:hypothetical protein [Nocardioides jiangxiensis]|uniref:Pyridoxamine 5'-phosphate oxidase n=1 Tax=Nocardioides jiangxiensis TaxID=3064524 RepID=A0ABT9B3S7_9ACTN|nr:hypothetical protein [Nocardioides sp. WY-20]MDO7869425.1 hypothetical protein [Nocardioides sp. WY-20]